MVLTEQHLMEFHFELLEFRTELEGMIAENQQRMHCGESMAFGDETFEKLRAKIQQRRENLVWLGEK